MTTETLTPTPTPSPLNWYTADQLRRGAADLRAAAGVMRVHGFGRGAFIDQPGGKVCLLGAVRVAIVGEAEAMRRTFCGNDDISHRYDVAFFALEDHIGYPPAYWNDCECDGGPQAIAALEGAADLCDRVAGE